jgi:hypothetical protein
MKERIKLFIQLIHLFFVVLGFSANSAARTAMREPHRVLTEIRMLHCLPLCRRNNRGPSFP